MNNIVISVLKTYRNLLKQEIKKTSNLDEKVQLLEVLVAVAKLKNEIDEKFIKGDLKINE